MNRLQWTLLLAAAALSILQMLPFVDEPLWFVAHRAPKPYSEDRLLLRRAATRGFVRMLEEPWVIRRYWRPVTSAWVWVTYRFAGMDPRWYRLQMSVAHALAAVLVGLLAARLSGVGWSGPLAGAVFALIWWAFWPRQWIAAAGDVLAAPLVAGAALGAFRGRWGRCVPLSVLAVGARELALLCVWPLLPKRARLASAGAVAVPGLVWAGLHWSYCARGAAAVASLASGVEVSGIAVLLAMVLCLTLIRRETWRQHGHLLVPALALTVAAVFSGHRYLYLGGVLLFPVLAGQLVGEWRRDWPVVFGCLTLVLVSWLIYPQLARELRTNTPAVWLAWTAR